MAVLIGIKVRGLWIGVDISYPVRDEAIRVMETASGAGGAIGSA